MTDQPGEGSPAPPSSASPEAVPTEDSVSDTTAASGAERQATAEVEGEASLPAAAEPEGAVEREEPAAPPAAGPEPEGAAFEPEGGVETSETIPQPEPVVEHPAAMVHEQIEWQPVVDGDKIEWQPVVASDLPLDPSDPPETREVLRSEPATAFASGEWPVEGEAEDPGFQDYDVAAAGAWEPELESSSDPEFAYPESTTLESEWSAASAETTSPASGNGAAAAPPGTTSAETNRPAKARRPGASAPRRRPGGGGPGEPGSGGAPGRGDGDGRDGGKKARRQVVILAVLTVVVIGIGLLGFLLSRGATEKGQQATPSTSAPSDTVARLPDSALQTYSDEPTGFTVKFPKSWQVPPRPPNADVRLVVDAGGNDGFIVRVEPIQVPATVENIENFKAVTDPVLFGEKKDELVQERLITVNGLLAYYYLYTFHDPVTNQDGIHVHYFVFEGNRFFAVTFQSVPVEDFRKQANVWDQVAESFTVKPRPNTTEAPTTVPASTVPPSTEAATTTVP